MSESERNLWTVSLPLPPSINKLYVTVRGRKILSSQGRKYILDCDNIFRDLDLPRFVFSTEDALRVNVEFYRKVVNKGWSQRSQRSKQKFSKWDQGNFTKILYDVVFRYLDVDDSQIVEEHLCKKHDPKNPRVRITVQKAPDSTWNQN